MKYLYKFEKIKSWDFYSGWKYENNRGEMWKIPLKKPDFYICLDKVGMPDNQKNFWKRSLIADMFIKDINGKADPNITHMILQKSKKGYFTWSRCDKWWRDEDNASYRYMGEMKVSNEEIEEYYYQIEMKKDANKYNL